MVEFNYESVPDPEMEFVCWLDVLGTKSTMKRSIPIVMNFIMKIHISALQALTGLTQGVKLYPMNDGVFITAKDKNAVLSIASTVLQKLGEEFVREIENKHKFVVQGALAYGPIYHGNTLMVGNSSVLGCQEEYCNRILIGMPMVQAYESESSAPPFGLALHESVRGFSSPDLPLLGHSVYFWWDKDNPKKIVDELKAALQKYFDWCKMHSDTLLFPKESIEKHARLAVDYFTV